jgi:hypothetical protein
VFDYNNDDNTDQTQDGANGKLHGSGDVLRNAQRPASEAVKKLMAEIMVFTNRSGS